MEEIESMTRDANLQLARLLSKIEHYQHGFIILLAKEGKIGTGIEILRTRIHIHQIEGLPLTDGFLFIGEAKKLTISGCQILLLLTQCRVRRILIGMRQSFRTPIVEYRGTAIRAAESFLIHSLFAEFLTAVKHERILLEEETHGCSRNRFHG